MSDEFILHDNHIGVVTAGLQFVEYSATTV